MNTIDVVHTSLTLIVFTLSTMQHDTYLEQEINMLSWRDDGGSYSIVAGNTLVSSTHALCQTTRFVPIDWRTQFKARVIYFHAGVWRCGIFDHYTANNHVMVKKTWKSVYKHSIIVKSTHVLVFVADTSAPYIDEYPHLRPFYEHVAKPARPFTPPNVSNIKTDMHDDMDDDDDENYELFMLRNLKRNYATS